MNPTPEQVIEIGERLKKGESGASIARKLGVSNQRVSEVRKQLGLVAPKPTPPARDAATKEPDVDDLSASEAGRMRSTLAKLLPPEERARIMVKLVKDADVPPATRARLIERIDSLCGVHEAPPERESTKPLFEIDALPPALSFSAASPGGGGGNDPSLPALDVGVKYPA